MVFSILSSDELVMLARVSFAGTALMAPMIFSAILFNKKPASIIPVMTLIGLIVFIISLFGWIPDLYWNIRIDIILLVVLGAFSIIANLLSSGVQE